MAQRLFYASQQVGFALIGTSTFTEAHGVQSLGMTTTFNLEQAFELGQISLYENIEEIPDVEVNLEKLLDGYCPLWLLASRNASSATLSGRSAARTTFGASVFDDAQDAASGTPTAQVTCSGMYGSTIGWNFPVQGNFSETLTLIGNHKQWITAGFTFTGAFNNADQPASFPSSGGVNRREDMLFAYTGTTLDVNSQLIDNNATVLPANIPGISASGTNNGTSDGSRLCHLQDMSVSCDLNREAIFEQGRKTPYFRYTNFPIEVTCSISALSTLGDQISATETGVAANGNNLTDYTIRIACREGLRLNLGTKNKLSSVSYDGGGVGGGNVICTYNFSNFNDLTARHSNDITVALRS